MMKSYDEMLHMKRPKSKYPSMSIEARAAQFGAFRTLTGHEENIDEHTGRHIEKMNNEVDKIECPEIFTDMIDEEYDI